MFSRRNEKCYSCSKLIWTLMLLHWAATVQAQKATHDIITLMWDLQGEESAREYESFEGTPYFHPEWVNAKLILANGKPYPNLIDLKINLYTNKIHYLDSKNRNQYVAMPGAVRQVKFKILPNEDSITFQSGFPPIGKNDLNTFYQVLETGKWTLLKQITKKLLESREYNAASITKSFETEQAYFVILNNENTRLKKYRDDILSKAGDKQKEVESFIIKERINLRAEADLVRLINFLNSLY